MIQQNTYDAVVLHEMIHNLGLGILWDYWALLSTRRGVIQYMGKNGYFGNQRIGFKGPPIVENLGGPATARAHWKEA